MADKSTVVVHSIDEIPFETIPVGKNYLLTATAPEIVAEVKRRLQASPVAFGRRAFVGPAYGMPGAIRIMIAPKPAPKGGDKPRGKPGRPAGKLATAVEQLMIDQHLIAARDGRHPQTIRNVVSRAAKRLKRTFTVEIARYDDPRMHWTPELRDTHAEIDFFIVTRTG